MSPLEQQQQQAYERSSFSSFELPQNQQFRESSPSPTFSAAFESNHDELTSRFGSDLKPTAAAASTEKAEARETTAAAAREPPSCAATVGIWSMNVVGSVGIIMVNKQVMSGYGFVFVSTLTGMHFALTALTGVASACAGLVPRQLSVPFGVLLGFALLGNASLVATNLSLLLNSVGFYQISKVSIIPTVCFFEAVFKGRTFTPFHPSQSPRPISPVDLQVFKGRTFTPRVKAAVAVVMLGVALCTVSEIHVNPLGLAVAAFAVLCSAMHMMLIGLLQERYAIGSFDLLSQSAPLQAFMLLLIGPSLDLLLTSRSLLDYHYQPYAIVFITLSCCLAVVCNLSAFLCIGKFSASTYQVLGHMKTVLVLVLGVLLFDSAISLKAILGMCIAVTGMVMYGHATAVQASAAGARGGGGGGDKKGGGGGGASCTGEQRIPLKPHTGLQNRSGDWIDVPKVFSRSPVDRPCGVTASRAVTGFENTPPTNAGADARNGMEGGGREELAERIVQLL
ncbi:unnamed protein product [Closterium sp. Yama58-4]|nr:unnamed protein product [Closterium sp. Yama58-4]